MTPELNPWPDDIRARFPALRCQTNWNQRTAHIFVRGYDYCECGLKDRRRIRSLTEEEKRSR